MTADYYSWKIDDCSSFTDTEVGKDTSEQIVACEFASDAGKFMLRETQFLRHEFTSLVGVEILMRGLQMLLGIRYRRQMPAPCAEQALAMLLKTHAVFQMPA